MVTTAKGHPWWPPRPKVTHDDRGQRSPLAATAKDRPRWPRPKVIHGNQGKRSAMVTGAKGHPWRHLRPLTAFWCGRRWPHIGHGGQRPTAATLGSVLALRSGSTLVAKHQPSVAKLQLLVVKLQLLVVKLQPWRVLVPAVTLSHPTAAKLRPRAQISARGRPR